MDIPGFDQLFAPAPLIGSGAKQIQTRELLFTLQEAVAFLGIPAPVLKTVLLNRCPTYDQRRLVPEGMVRTLYALIHGL